MSTNDSNNTPVNDSEDKGLIEFLRQVAERQADNNDESDEESENMNAADYHNKAVDLARRNNYSSAVQTCKNGLKLFPNDVDLLADTIKYSCEAGDLKTAGTYYALLADRPRVFWNWRAYSFSFDYLILDPMRNEEACRALIDDYKRYITYQEKAYMSESELEEALGNHERSMTVLVDAVEKLPNAPQCALRLADMQMDRGLFADVLKTCSYGLSASCEVQPSINIPYLLLLQCLAKEALLHKRVSNGAPITTEEIDAMLKEYAMLRDDFPEMAKHARVIHIREKCLTLLKVSLGLE